MRITKHISFYYLENRIKYINKIIEETNNYKYETDIFIHTNNNELSVEKLLKYNNGFINIVFHDLSNIHPYYLTWKCRDLLYIQRFEYDIFMYIEDDIMVPNKAIEYWEKYNEKLIEFNYNLGFLRIEIDNKGDEYITDLYGVKFDKKINVDDNIYCVNNKNPYCAFWIYNKKEFNRFAESKYYNINNIDGPCIREKSAYGLINSNWYINTIIPIIDNKLIEECKIYHMPNNYVYDKSNLFATIKFNDCL